MRALRVIGLADDGAVVCEADAVRDGEQPERFSLPADDRLRAAARGDLARLGQIEIELESQMRPREIQARIRAGASVEDVATAAGMPPERVERFAYPVLLERSRTAELAQRAHPVRDDGPDLRTLGEVVATTFNQRGHDYESVIWDSWRNEDGKWVVQLRWKAGRSDNRAHWIFHPGAHGGTVTTLDDLAGDLIDPTVGKPLRTVRPVTSLAEQALQLDDPAKKEVNKELRPRAEATPRSEPARQPQPEPQPTPASAGADKPAAEDPQAEHAQHEETEATGTTEAAPRRGRNNRPIVPSWEDVLLGVRSNR
jgi:hypothetical protein